MKFVTWKSFRCWISWEPLKLKHIWSKSCKNFVIFILFTAIKVPAAIVCFVSLSVFFLHKQVKNVDFTARRGTHALYSAASCTVKCNKNQSCRRSTLLFLDIILIFWILPIAVTTKFDSKIKCREVCLFLCCPNREEK